jgi:tellurite resistance protein TerC
MQLFHYLHYGLSAILIFVGAKMLLVDVYKLPVAVALGVIAGILLIAVIASLMRPPQRDTVTTPTDPLP